MLSSPIWAAVALLHGWLLASPGEGVQASEVGALWSIRPIERSVTSRLPLPDRSLPASTTVPALTLDVHVPTGALPMAIAPVRIEGLRLGEAGWSPFEHRLGAGDGWLKVSPRRGPLSTRVVTHRTQGTKDVDSQPATLGSLSWEVNHYLHSLSVHSWRQTVPARSSLEIDLSGRGDAEVSWLLDWGDSEPSDRVHLPEEFDSGTVSRWRYLGDDPDRAFVRQALHRIGLPDGIYWNKAVFLPMANFLGSAPKFGINMQMRW